MAARRKGRKHAKKSKSPAAKVVVSASSGIEKLITRSFNNLNHRLDKILAPKKWKIRQSELRSKKNLAENAASDEYGPGMNVYDT